MSIDIDVKALIADCKRRIEDPEADWLCVEPEKMLVILDRLERAEAAPTPPLAGAPDLPHTPGGIWTRPLYYTDMLNGKQVCRDDLWAVTTQELTALTERPAPVAQSVSVPEQTRKIISDLLRVLHGIEQGSDEHWKFITNVCSNAEDLLANSPHDPDAAPLPQPQAYEEAKQECGEKILATIPGIYALPQQGEGSIDSPEFDAILKNFYETAYSFAGSTPHPAARAKIINYIDAWHRARLARTAAPSDTEALKNLLDALQPLLDAHRVSEEDSISSLEPDSYVIFTGSGSWAKPVNVTRGHLRSLETAAWAITKPKAPSEHPDDLAVDCFATAMKAKMAKQRKKGRHGWDDPAQCSVEHLQTLMSGHMEKGDPVDVGNFAMMLFNRGERTKDPMQVKPWVDAAVAALNAPSVAERYSDVLEVQRKEAATGDSYMRGLYNGMLMMCANLDNAEYHPMPKPAPSEGQAIPTDLSKRLRAAIAVNGVIDRVTTLAAADEIDYYYSAALSWKRSAQVKDAEIGELRGIIAKKGGAA